MDAYVRDWLKKDRHTEYLLIGVLTVLAVLVRISMRTFVSDDWVIFWDDWFFHLESKGFAALADDFYDYAPPMLYLLYLITLLPVNYMTAFKGFCCLLDFAGAAAVAGGISLSPDTLESAQQAAERTGEAVGEFLARAVETQAKRDGNSLKLGINPVTGDKLDSKGGADHE